MDLSQDSFRLKESTNQVRLCEMLGLENLQHRYLQEADLQKRLTGPACTETLNGAEEAEG